MNHLHNCEVFKKLDLTITSKMLCLLLVVQASARSTKDLSCICDFVCDYNRFEHTFVTFKQKGLFHI